MTTSLPNPPPTWEPAVGSPRPAADPETHASAVRGILHALMATMLTAAMVWIIMRILSEVG